MTMVAARRYRDGKLVEDRLPDDCPSPAKSEFDWVGLVEPSDGEMQAVAAKYRLHPLAVEDAMSQRQAPKAEAYGAQLFVIARTADLGDNDRIAYGQTALFLGKDFLVTVRQGSTRAHDRLRAQLEAVPEKLAEGPDFVLHAVLDFIVDGYGPLLDRLEAEVGEMEDNAVARFPDPGRIRRIFHLRRELRRFEDIAGRMEEVAAKLAEVEQPAIDRRARPYFRDVLDHTRRAVTKARWLNDTLGAMIEVAGLLEQSRQGAITRQLAAWAAILAVPTAIAGIYGMNFAVMPELDWRYGYFMVVGAMALLCVGLFVRFRRIGWL
ncbi:MAG TPA: magnesium and cobalt transport protein CorA [Croceibacterium sp.]|nr:magnesium and cobalt transport protein CorA [Croceibacterium sp.]